jgi:hypothetical protein
MSRAILLSRNVSTSSVLCFFRSTEFMFSFHAG